MSHAPDSRTHLTQIDAEIADVVRLMAEKNQRIIISEHEASASERGPQEIRRMLEQMWRQRRQAWEQLQDQAP